MILDSYSCVYSGLCPLMHTGHDGGSLLTQHWLVAYYCLERAIQQRFLRPAHGSLNRKR